MRRVVFFVLAVTVFSFFSCALNRSRIGASSVSRTYGIQPAAAEIDEPESEQPLPDTLAEGPAEPEPKPFILTFAGDLMAHTVNFNMADYNLIYTDVKNILDQDDLSFINVETPVCDALPLSTYPRFNVHTPYLRAAVQAGFDVFSFANNHTNDHGVIGIDGSLAAVYAIEQEYAAQDTAASKTLAFSGLKKQADEPIRVSRISYQGWNILFCSVTELLNSYDSSKKRLYYSAPTEKGRAELLAVIAQARNEYPCDIFILSLHVNEPEYIRTVSKEKKTWFKQLGEAGADIIWAHHPHVMQPWETITVERKLPAAEINSGMTAGITGGNGGDEYSTQLHQVFCMYSMGNFISGQRFTVRYDDPAFYREYTGDAVMLQLRYTRTDSSLLTFSVLPIVITQYNAPAPVVKRFTNEWIETLGEKEKAYFKTRLSLMNDYLPLTDSAVP